MVGGVLAVLDILGPYRLAENIFESSPVTRVAKADRDPLILACAGVDVLDGELMPAVPPTGQQHPGGVVLDDLQRAGVEDHVDHRQLHQLTLPGAGADVPAPQG